MSGLWQSLWLYIEWGAGYTICFIIYAYTRARENGLLAKGLSFKVLLRLFTGLKGMKVIMQGAFVLMLTGG
ncbi:hypothetical protein PT286_08290 [Neisseriaceae bacterium ESL0693]|nr:hypothetical protein [Neisseriaceae bacterium ESL0693]